MTPEIWFNQGELTINKEGKVTRPVVSLMSRCGWSRRKVEAEIIGEVSRSTQLTPEQIRERLINRETIRY